MDPLSLGQYLRDSREAKELTLDDAVQTLKIRKRLLEAFEQGEFEFSDLSQVQTRGFVRNYAQYLGLDSDTVVIYYDSAVQNRTKGRGWRRGRKPKTESRKNKTQERRKNRRRRRLDETHPREDEDSDPRPIAPRSITDTNPSLPRVTLGDMRDRRDRRLARFLNTLVILLVGLAAVAVIAFVAIELIQQNDEDNPNNAFVLGDLPPTSTRTLAPTFTPRPTDNAGQPAISQNFDGTGVVITVEAQQRTWLRVITDGNVQINELVEAGNVMEYRSINEIVLSASNARALNIIYNGQQQGTFGSRGQAVDITFTTDDLDIQTGPGFDPTTEATDTATPTQDSRPATLLAAQTPSNTPGPSPTPTNTPTITLTPSITNTPVDTPTPSNTPTITFTPSNTPTPSDTPPPTNTPTVTPTPSITPTPSPTAVLPPRQTPSDPTETKESP